MATSLADLGKSIVDAIKNEVGGDWPIIAQGTSAATRALASVAIDLADPGNTMTPDERQEIMANYKDALKSAIQYHQIVAEVVVKKAIDAAIKVVVDALPALVGIA